MLLKKRQNAIKKDLANGEEIYLKLTSGRYKGSILQLEKIKNIHYWWEHEHQGRKRYKFLLNAPGLIRRLSVDPKHLNETGANKIVLTNTPNITKKQNLPRDFVNTLVDVDDYLFGKGALIQIISISTHNHLEARCIASENDDIKVNKIKTYRSLKKFLKIDDPTQILLRI